MIIYPDFSRHFFFERSLQGPQRLKPPLVTAIRTAITTLLHQNLYVETHSTDSTTYIHITSYRLWIFIFQNVHKDGSKDYMRLIHDSDIETAIFATTLIRFLFRCIRIEFSKTISRSLLFAHERQKVAQDCESKGESQKERHQQVS